MYKKGWDIFFYPSFFGYIYSIQIKTNYIMPSKDKGQLFEELEELTLGRTNAFLIQCISEWMDSSELEEFVEFVETEA